MRYPARLEAGRGSWFARFRQKTASRRSEVALRSLARLIDEVLPPSVFGKLVALRNREVTAVVSADKETAARASAMLRRRGLTQRSSNRLGFGAGVSLDKRDITHLPEALTEARMALDLAHPGSPLVPFADIDLTEFLIRRADKAVLRLIPDWARQVNGKDIHRDDLFRTIYTFAECSLNVKQTARRLGIHTNTVYFRLN
jgi:sugar diacid utilization regulator